jgi:hypothetical protein
VNEELHRSIGRLEGKIDHVLNNQSSFKETFDTHDQRLRHLEGWHYKSLGVIAAISFFFSITWDWIKGSFHR